MSSLADTGTRYVVICVDHDQNTLEALVRDIGQICGSQIEIQACSDAEQALEFADGLAPPDVRVPLILAEQDLPGTSGVELLLSLHERPDYRAARKVLLSAQATVEDLRQLLNRGALHRSLARPWSPEALRDCVLSVLPGFFIHHAPDDMHRFPELLDAAELPRAQQAARLDRRAMDVQLSALKRSFLANVDLSDEAVERAMGAGIDDALNIPPRRDYPAGSVLLRQDEPVDTISILVSGEIQLSRMADDCEVVLHTHTAGRIIGLLALAQHQRAFFTCRAITDVTVIPLGIEQLETALQINPWLSGYLVTALLRSMSKRTKRTAQLQVQVERLNSKLQAERDQLARALQQLESAQTRLVESEKMATLGQLSAGVAHELNNPVAAIQRAVDFLSEDLVALFGDLPDGAAATACMLSVLTSQPLSTREERQCRAALTREAGDGSLARRLVKVGISSAGKYRSWLGNKTDAERDRLLEAMERYHQVGLSLRNLSTCSDRVSTIVSSLRSYTRNDQAPVANVNLHEGLDGTLLMFAHDLRNVEVSKSYGDLPAVECCVGEINQVWTNIIANAVQAMSAPAALRIETDTPASDQVRVRIIDNGPGVAPQDLERVFDLNFTTKTGQASFGLGMGLTICRQIVTSAGGTIEMESQPGRTCVTVVLPVRYPGASVEG